MTAKLAQYHCTRCGHDFEQGEQPLVMEGEDNDPLVCWTYATTCHACGSPYVHWINYHDFEVKRL
jgi:hypothetical protein